MIAPRVISLDLDDTVWPVAPVLAAAEIALLSWLRAHHPRAVQGLDIDSMRELRARIAERFPEQRHDMTFLRRRALGEQFAAAGYAVRMPRIRPPRKRCRSSWLNAIAWSSTTMCGPRSSACAGAIGCSR
jgi:hypothetical protein